MYNFFVEYTTPTLVFLTYGLNIVTLVLLYVLIFNKQEVAEKILNWLDKKILWIGFVISLGAVLGSLVYSNIIGFLPCFLCWWERIFLYPLAIIWGVGIYVREKSVWIYSVIFSGIAVLLSAYHSYIRLVGHESSLCTDAAVSCTKQYITGYGYMNIPVMALSTALFMLLLTLVYKMRYNNIHE